jgi:hypothetical protein
MVSLRGVVFQPRSGESLLAPGFSRGKSVGKGYERRRRESPCTRRHFIDSRAVAPTALGGFAVFFVFSRPKPGAGGTFAATRLEGILNTEVFSE